MIDILLRDIKYRKYPIFPLVVSEISNIFASVKHKQVEQ